MQDVPVEVLDNILSHLLVLEKPLAERYAAITENSKKDALNARLVCRGFFESRSLQATFVQVLEETLLLYKDPMLQHLSEVAHSRYARKLKTLTISTQHTVFKEPPNEPFYTLDDLLKRFRNVEKVRFSAPDKEPHGMPDSLERLKVVSRILGALWYANIRVQNIEMSSRTLVIQALGIRDADMVALASRRRAGFVKRLTVSELQRKHKGVLGRHLRYFKRLEVFEVELQTFTPIIAKCTKQHITTRPIGIGEMKPLFNLKVFRLSSVSSARFGHDEILQALQLFPNLEILGLAYVILDNFMQGGIGAWTYLLQGLQSLHLKSIQLLFPACHAWQDEGPTYAPIDFQGNYETINTVIGYRIQIRRYANGLEVIPFEEEVFWRNHPLAGEDGTKPLGFNIFDV